MSVDYNGTDYYFVLNLQGDVMALVNETGTAVVEYTYDAWGNILTTTGTLASTLGADNSLRYRGYVYDTETGMYYLQSRYYDPELGRFINADSLVTTGNGMLCSNMFAYCLNNPVNGYDPCGTCFHRWDFWNDCEECGGKTIGEKWGEYTTSLYASHMMQIEWQQQIDQTSINAVRDSAVAVSDAIVEGIENQNKAQQQETQAFYTVFIDPLDATEKSRLRGTLIATAIAFGISVGFGLPGVVAGTASLSSVTVAAGVDALKSGLSYYLFRIWYEDVKE